jgi:hypothetical protein
VTRLLHRLWICVLLAMALGLGQQAALRHELGHAFKRIDTPAQQPAPGGDTCAKCFAFSPLSGALPSAAAALVLAVTPDLPFAFVAIPAASRTVVTALARAPPRLS